ncbi:hypothetical protein [Streptomyces sp. NPDC006012]|uniref:hypothetical protein n=1 Tax=Streptomyces sp. NPDC006012 TaxID=3364739 RepID=UPI003673B464
MSATHREIPVEVLEILVLPVLLDLDEDRSAGRTCVWGGERLTIETAVDLGEQRTSSRWIRPGDKENWFPRACRACVADRAHRGLFAHAPVCSLCRTRETAADCIVGRGLYRLVRDCRR